MKAPLRKRIKIFLINNPGSKLGEIADELKDVKYGTIAAAVRTMIIKNEVKKNGLEYYSTEILAPAIGSKPSSENSALSKFSPRELLEELKSRGYVWDKMWVETTQFVYYDNI